MQKQFSYHAAFSRNIGWVTEEEQSELQSKRIAIAGMGGVGGSHLLTLTRLGIGGFNLSDFDKFEIVNFNRQAGARTSSLNQPKLDVLVNMALDINPNLEINVFPDGVSAKNVHSFLDKIDLYVDGLDFFAVEARRSVFAACSELGIPATTAAPLGMGTALLNFLPGEMTFEEYFRLDGLAEFDQLLRFYIGLAPKMLQSGYLVDPSMINLSAHRGPSTSMGCELCAGIAATQALKILLNRGKVIAAPHGLQFDAFKNKLSHTWRPWGANNPVQAFLFIMAKNKLKNIDTQRSQDGDEPEKQLTIIEQVLDYARWAPSGDNSQPWRFEIIADNKVTIHGHDTREHCIYDLEGHASQFSLGALLETIIIAASNHQYSVSYKIRYDQPEGTPIIDIELHDSSSVKASSLYPYVKKRTVQRRPFSTRTIESGKYTALESAVGDEFKVLWFDSFADRISFSKLLFKNGQLRLRLPEAFSTHKSIIQWDASESKDRIPDRAIGAGKMTLLMMRWVMRSWSRVSFMNRYMGGTITPGVELDLLPALLCGAHFVIVSNNKPATQDDYINAGRATQRFWLTATRSGLFIQPAYTPLVFHEYISRDVYFSADEKSRKRAISISRTLDSLIGKDNADRAFFMGRIGYSTTPGARSTRIPLESLYFDSGKS